MSNEKDRLKKMMDEMPGKIADLPGEQGALFAGAMHDFAFQRAQENYPTTEGIIPQYARIVKTVTEDEDVVKKGSWGTTLAAIDNQKNIDKMLSKGIEVSEKAIKTIERDKRNRYAYFVQWDELPEDVVSFVLGEKIEEIKTENAPEK